MEEHILEDINYVGCRRQKRPYVRLQLSTTSAYRRNDANEYLRAGVSHLPRRSPGDRPVGDGPPPNKYGYESPESFSKAFSRFHGSTPKQQTKRREASSVQSPCDKITLEGGNIMDYRMEHRERQQFIAVVRLFPTRLSIRQRTQIPDFWTECGEKNLLDR